MEFKKITRESQPIIRKYISKWNIENADFTFTTLYLWGRHGKILYAEQDGALFLYYNFPSGTPFFLPPIPEDPQSDYKYYADLAIQEMKNMGFAPNFRSVAEPFRELLEKAYPDVPMTFTRDACDYIYSTESLMTLRGKKLHAKRNHINKFLEANENWEYCRIDESNLHECMALYEDWVETKDEPTIEEYDERITVELAIKYMTELGLIGAAIRINGKIRAFTVGERISKDLAIIHIEKADTEINGLFPLINREFVTHEFSDTQFINREDDMGLEGLRKAKLSYNPLRLIEKHRMDF